MQPDRKLGESSGVAENWLMKIGADGEQADARSAGTRSSEIRPSEIQQTEIRQEGQAQFELGPAFFRPQAQTARELGLLAAAVQRAETGQLRVLETMAGCGIRGVRYGLEAGADFVWSNDADPDVLPTLEANLARNLDPDRYRVSRGGALQLLSRCFGAQDYYDLVDIDAFGNPSEFVGASLGAVKIGGLIYLTGSDGRSLTGHAPENALKTYGFFPRSNPSCQEQSLRFLIGSLWHAAATRGFGIEPVFSYFGIQTYRVMVRLRPRTQSSSAYKFLGHCHGCGEYQTIGWRKLSRAHCKNHEPPLPLTLSGPLWLGALHDAKFVRKMLHGVSRLPQARHSVLTELLQTFEAEADMPPYLFPLGEIGKRGQMDPPKRDRLIAALQTAGYRASPTHLSAQAIKTDASLERCIELSQGSS